MKKNLILLSLSTFWIFTSFTQKRTPTTIALYSEPFSAYLEASIYENDTIITLYCMRAESKFREDSCFIDFSNKNNALAFFTLCQKALMSNHKLVITRDQAMNKDQKFIFSPDITISNVKSKRCKIFFNNISMLLSSKQIYRMKKSIIEIN